MKTLIDIRKYRDCEYVLEIGDMVRSCPLYNVSEGMWVVGNEHLSYGSDTEFSFKVARNIAEKLDPLRAETLVTAGSKAIALAYEVARILNFTEFGVAKKTISPYIGKFISTEVNSITSGKKEKLYLDNISAERIKGKWVILFDDVISTGSTMKSLIDLVQKADAKIAALASVWIEGPWPFECFYDYFKAGELIFLGVLPVFADKEHYEKLCSDRDRVKAKLGLI